MAEIPGTTVQPAQTAPPVRPTVGAPAEPMPQASATPPVAGPGDANLASASSSGPVAQSTYGSAPWENPVAQKAEQLASREGGYFYDTTQCDPANGHGVCTDFALEAFAAGDQKLYAALKSDMGANESRRCTGQTEFFRDNSDVKFSDVPSPEHPVDPKGPTGCKEGDLVYWGAHHVAVVTKVDEQGHPLEIAHAHGNSARDGDPLDNGTRATTNPFNVDANGKPTFKETYPGQDNQPRVYEEFHRPDQITAIVRKNV
ncbi:MAG: hypothetical protein JWM80_5450 [Cyanobacteria bacterium RYN_339]|nr:hypothetical protein [Cyanobacteria bacterium RYN_339]